MFQRDPIQEALLLTSLMVANVKFSDCTTIVIFFIFSYLYFSIHCFSKSHPFSLGNVFVSFRQNFTIFDDYYLLTSNTRA